MRARVLFVNLPHPTRVQRRWVASYHAPNFLVPPLELLGLAAWVREQRGASVAVIDAIAQRLDPAALAVQVREFRPEYVVALLGFETLASDLLELERLRFATDGAIHIVFGHLPTWEPERTLQSAGVDVVLRGEPEGPILSVLDHGVPREIQPGLAARSAEGVLLGPPAPRRPDLDDLPTADHGLVDLRHYGESFVRGPTGALLSARGCPWDCAFCVRAYGRELALRSVPRLMEDIDHLARVGARSVRFMDDTFTAVRPRTLALCEALARRPRPLPWTCLTRLDRLDPEICLCMARAGCSRVYVGVESGDEGRRESFGKRLGDEALHVGVRAAKDAGLEVCGFFIVGSPGEGRRELQASTMLAAALGLDFVIVTRLQRWPGTRMAEASPSKEGGDDGFLAERTFYRRFYLRPSWVVRHAHLALRTPGDVWIGARELGRYTAGRVLGRDFI